MNKTASRYETILAAGFVLFSRNPGASLSDFAQEAGIGRATLHRYFASREALMDALCHAALSEIDAAIDSATHDAKSYTEALYQSIGAILPLAHRHLFLSYVTVDDPARAAQFEKSNAQMREVIDLAKAEGTFDAHVPTAWIATSYDALVHAGWERVLAQDLTPRQATDLVWRTLTKGMAP